MSDNGEDVYEVEAIIQDAFDTATMSRLYYVKWLGYDETENTWQNQSSLQHLEIFEAYETKRKPILTKPKATLSTLSNGKEDDMVAVSKAKRKTLSNGKEDDIIHKEKKKHKPKHKSKKKKKKKKRKKKHKKKHKKTQKATHNDASEDDEDRLCTRELIHHDTVDTDTSDDEPIIRVAKEPLIPKKPKTTSIWKIPKYTDPLEPLRKKRKLNHYNHSNPYTKPKPPTISIAPSIAKPPVHTSPLVRDYTRTTHATAAVAAIPDPKPSMKVDPPTISIEKRSSTVSVKSEEEIVGPTQPVFVDLTMENDETDTNRKNNTNDEHDKLIEAPKLFMTPCTPSESESDSPLDTTHNKKNTNDGWLGSTSTMNINSNKTPLPVVTLHAPILACGISGDRNHNTTRHSSKRHHRERDQHYYRSRHRTDRRSRHRRDRRSHRSSRREVSRNRGYYRSRHRRDRRSRTRSSRSSSSSPSRSRNTRRTPTPPRPQRKERPKMRIVNTMKTGREIQQMFADPWSKPHDTNNIHVVDHPIDVDLTIDNPPTNPSASTFITSSSTFPTVPPPPPQLRLHEPKPQPKVCRSKPKSRSFIPSSSVRHSSPSPPLPMPTEWPQFTHKFRVLPPNGLYLSADDMTRTNEIAQDNWLDPGLDDMNVSMSISLMASGTTNSHTNQSNSFQFVLCVEEAGHAIDMVNCACKLDKKHQDIIRKWRGNMSTTKAERMVWYTRDEKIKLCEHLRHLDSAEGCPMAYEITSACAHRSEKEIEAFTQQLTGPIHRTFISENMMNGLYLGLRITKWNIITNKWNCLMFVINDTPSASIGVKTKSWSAIVQRIANAPKHPDRDLFKSAFESIVEYKRDELTDMSDVLDVDALGIPVQSNGIVFKWKPRQNVDRTKLKTWCQDLMQKENVIPTIGHHMFGFYHGQKELSCVLLTEGAIIPSLSWPQNRSYANSLEWINSYIGTDGTDGTDNKLKQYLLTQMKVNELHLVICPIQMMDLVKELNVLNNLR